MTEDKKADEAGVIAIPLDVLEKVLREELIDDEDVTGFMLDPKMIEGATFDSLRLKSSIDMSSLTQRLRVAASTWRVVV